MKCYMEYRSAREVQNLVSGTSTVPVTCAFQTNRASDEGGKLAGRGANNQPGRTTGNNR
jgi:hypothetical protein